MSDVLQLCVTTRAAMSRRLGAYMELTKPRIAVMVLIATALGFLLSLEGLPTLADAAVLLHVVVGTALVGGSANALNQYLEAEHDARMTRTADRPLPSGRLGRAEVFSFSLLTFFGGVVYLALQTNLLAAFVATAAWVSYGFVYTPLKRRTAYCVHVGAIPGALPPVIGWAAGAGSLSIGAFLLFGVLLVWQLPHFASIAWIYREDYERAGFSMISVRDGRGTKTSRHLLGYSILLLLVSLLPAIVGTGGYTYGVGAAALGCAYLASGVWFLLRRTREIARLSMLASVTYLPSLFVLMLIDKACRV